MATAVNAAAAAPSEGRGRRAADEVAKLDPPRDTRFTAYIARTVLAGHVIVQVTAVLPGMNPNPVVSPCTRIAHAMRPRLSARMERAVVDIMVG